MSANFRRFVWRLLSRASPAWYDGAGAGSLVFGVRPRDGRGTGLRPDRLSKADLCVRTRACYARRVAPNPDSAAAAVETLRAELEMINGSLEALDRKAALVPATLGVVAGIFIAPDDAFTQPQQVLLVAALVAAIIAVFAALQVLWARRVSVGPDAKTVAMGTHWGPADFNNAVAGSMALSVAKLAEVADWKSARLNIGLASAAITILLLAGARLVGGIT